MKFRKPMLTLFVLSGLVFSVTPALGASAAVAVRPVGGGGGSGGGSGGSGGGDPAAPQCSSGFIGNTNVTDNWTATGVTGVNDVAAGADGSVWYVTGTPGSTGSTVREVAGANIKINSPLLGGKRIAVDPQGNPWIVDFNGNIFRLVNGSFQQLPGLARDIGIGGNGAVWIIGTNSQNGSFQVYSWNGSSWVGDPGSGEEIDVAANGDPVVNGSDGKVWIKNGGSDNGWSQVGLGGLTAFDMGLSPCNLGAGASLGGSEMWFTNPINFGSSFPPLVFSLVNALEGPYSTLNSGPVVAQDTTMGQINASHVAVDILGHAWVVADPGGCDCQGDLLERPLN